MVVNKYFWIVFFILTNVFTSTAWLHVTCQAVLTHMSMFGNDLLYWPMVICFFLGLLCNSPWFAEQSSQSGLYCNQLKQVLWGRPKEAYLSLIGSQSSSRQRSDMIEWYNRICELHRKLAAIFWTACPAICSWSQSEIYNDCPAWKCNICNAATNTLSKQQMGKVINIKI